MPLSRLLCRGLVLLLFAPALAQAADPAALRAELSSIYQQLLIDPSDRALNRRMIEIAVELKDYDAAIGAVERLIFYDPTNAALQLEAARLYMQIESYAAAAGYLKEAVALPGLTAEQRADATTLLAKANRATRPSPWSGFGQVGMRYQTNANHGSVALGLSEPFPFEKPTADWNTFALGTLGLAEPVDDNLSIEASVSGYYADQQIVDRLDLGRGVEARAAELSILEGATEAIGALERRPLKVGAAERAAEHGRVLDHRTAQVGAGDRGIREGALEDGAVFEVEPLAVYAPEAHQAEAREGEARPLDVGVGDQQRDERLGAGDEAA